MKKVLTALVAALSLGMAVATTAPQPAEARCIGCAVGLGVLGGLAVGAAIANSRPAYAVQPGYVPYAAYAAPMPVSCPGGYWARQPMVDGYGRVVGYSRPRFFCP